MTPSIREPIAIVGIGCRLPGGIDSPDALADALLARRSAVREVPPDRWLVDAFYHPDFKKPGYIHARRGGFVDGVDQFDAGFFGISPHEARRMDPQQRWALECALRAIEDAGVPLEQLAGRRVAVIVGCSGHDYDAVQVTHAGRTGIGPTTNTGSALSIVSNRISYLFDLRGPSFTVDTACSSSLYAFHHACRAIWSGDAEAALAGGVNLVLKPEPTIGFSKGSYLSPDGECRAFSDHANGYVRSEGAAILFLKPLSRALAAGDRIYALVRGSALNQDGRTPGMTLPSGDAQQLMLETAYRDAGIDPREVSYVEAHGTGTPAGDPIEAGAIGRVVGVGREGTCFIGSIKTNIGHLESASGVAGLIKLALTLQRRTVFPNLNFRAPNPNIPFDELHLRVPTEAIAIEKDGPIFGGVNSFGFGGSNAHVVLESPPDVAVPVSTKTACTALFVSARTPAALKATAEALAAQLDNSLAIEHNGGTVAVSDLEDHVAVEDIANALSRRRSRFELRAAVTGSSRDDLSRALRELDVQGRYPEGRAAQPIAFIFTGQGPQWWRMGRELFATSPIFRAAVERVDAALRVLGWLESDSSTLIAELHADEASSRMGETRIAQPCIYALQIGLVEMLRAHGVTPSAVVGHSIGELAAAVCAGVITIEEGARIVYWRSRCQAQAEGAGCMAAVGVSEAEARELCKSGEIELAAVNGPRIVTLAGTHAAIDKLLVELDRKEVFSKKLAVSVPFHCWLMDPIEGDFRTGLASVATRAPRIPFYSTVSAQIETALDVDYWWQNIRAAVNFDGGITALARDGFTTFVEIGPHPVLTRGALDTLSAAGVKGNVIATLRHESDEPKLFAKALANLFVAGAAVHATPDAACPHVDLPKHPLEPTRHWLETEADRQERIGADRVHPHVGDLERGIKSTDTFDCVLAVDPKDETYLVDHQVQGVVVFPGAGQIETILSAGRHVFGDAVFLEDFELLRPVVVEAEAEQTYRLEVYSDEGHFTLGALADREANAWLEYSRGRINHCDRFQAPSHDVAAWQARCAREFDASEFYKGAAASGLELGPAFQVIRRVWVSPDRETLSLVEPTEALAHEVARYHVHPAILDGVLQTAAIGMLAGTDKHALFLPQRVRRARLHTPYRGEPLWCHSRITLDRAKDVTLDVWAVTADGTPIVTLEGLVVRRVRGTSKTDKRGALYEPRWQPAPRAPEVVEIATRTTQEIVAPVRGTWLVIGDGAIANRIAGALETYGHEAVVDVTPKLDKLERIVGIVHLATIGAPTLQAAIERGPVAMGELLTAIGERGLWTEDGAAIWLVTSGATGGATAPLAAPLWGFGRVLGSEQPRHATTLVDLSASATFADVDALVDEILAGPHEHEIAIRDGVRYVQTLEPIAADGERAARDVELATTPVRAVVTTPGNIASIKLERQPKATLAPDEILIDVRSVGLNFKDVVVATAMLGDEAWTDGMSGATIGMDCAGVVLAIGANVTELAVGDDVVGLAPACAGNRAVAHRRHLVKKPAVLSFAEAAAVPTAYVTAGIALERLARLQAGETVLIHAAAGGVGIAAIAIAQRLGARVFATTSSDDKRAFLKGLGVTHIFNSRSAQFRDDVMAASDGRGVDVVLNSVAGQLLTQSIRCLAPFGRFVEIGKADLYANRQLGLKFFAENRSFICFDLNRLAAKREPELAERLARDLAWIADGTYKKIPVRELPLTQIADAVHALAQGKTIGKVVVDVPSSGLVAALPETTLAFDPEKTWVVTGGCGGFGLQVAEWLAEKGARHLALWGRRGLPGDQERAIVDAMRERGVDVIVSKTDVADRDQVESRLEELRAERPIGGIFHAAMVLDDAPIGALDRARYTAVVAPKLAGAWHLHEATRGDQLEQFVMFSSIASIVGTPGQANYAAANAGLDALAAHRTALGLAATSINWGVLDTGVVARASAEQRRKILGQGVDAFSVAEALAHLERTLLDRPAQRVVARIDWKRLARIGARKDRPGRFASLVADTAQAASGRLADQLAAASDPAALVATKVAALVAQVAGLGNAPVDLDAGLDRFGFDSLMATQLQSWIDGEVGVTIPLVRLLRRPSIRDLSVEIVASWKRSARADADETVQRPEPRPDAKARLFCLPPMGADASIFVDWIGALPPEIELCTLSLPKLDGPLGHLIGDANALRDHVLERMEPLVDLPFAIYGHSLGGWLALDLADALRERGHAPKFLALGALPTLETMSSLIPDDVTAADQITDDHVRAAMERMAIPNAALAIAPMVRRDLWLGAAARFDGADLGRSQPAPVILMGGDTDPIITVDKAAHMIYGAPPHEVWRLPGGHFFLAEEASQSTMHRHLRSIAGRLID